MPHSKTLRLVSACCILLSCLAVKFSAADQNAAPADTGTLILHLRTPDGKPVQNRIVNVVSTDDFSATPHVVDMSGITDPSGTLLLRLLPYVWRLHIIVRDIGFGATGSFELLPDEFVAPPIPPLVPFAQISGTVDKSLFRPGETVQADQVNQDEKLPCTETAPIDAHGKFLITNLFPGSYDLTLNGDTHQPASGYAKIAPGEHRSGIVLKIPDTRSVLRPEGIENIFDTKENHSKATGTVLTASGRPNAGATVYAVCDYWNYNGDIIAVRETTTDTDGIFKFADLPVHIGEMTVWFLATSPQQIPALAFASSRPNWKPDWTPGTKNPDGDITVHLTVPTRHTQLSIRVLEAGKPLKNAVVRLKPQAKPNYDEYIFVEPGSEELFKTVNSFLSPEGRTDSHGNITFSDILPGLWDIAAVNGTEQDASNVLSKWSDIASGLPYSLSRGVPVVASRSTSYVLTAFAQPKDFSIRILDPENRPLPPGDVDFEIGNSGQGVDGATPLKVDSTGNVGCQLRSDGIWTVKARFHKGLTPDDSTRDEPYDEAFSVLAVSPLIDHANPIVLKSVYRGPGGIRVRLLDDSDQPAHGTIIVSDLVGAYYCGGCTDNHGEVTFPEMPSGTYQLVANIFGRSDAPVTNGNLTTLPADRTLEHRSVLLPAQVTVQSNAIRSVTMRPRSVGYVRGNFQLTSRDGLYEYDVLPPDRSEYSPGFALDAKGSELICGPLLPGKVAFPMMQYRKKQKPSQNFLGRFPYVVKVIGSKVVHVHFVPVGPIQPLPSDPPESYPPLRGTVFMHDGHTPAWAARAEAFMTDTWADRNLASSNAEEDTLSAVVNPVGQLQEDNGGYSYQPTETAAPGSPTTSVVVAYLPGECGAVIAPYTPGKSVRLTLPAPVSLHGRVTVGGQSAAGLDSTFRIRAAYQGRGKLNDILSVETTAQADGTFDLAGLTPGVYHVQAARDGIWLSGTQTVTVGDKDLSDATFDIGLPGTAMVFHFRDADGKPLIAQTVTLARPAGPLTELLWPKTLTTDGAGDLRLEGLEAGTHTISTQRAAAASETVSWSVDHERTIYFVVPAYAGGKQTVVQTVVSDTKATH